MAGSEVHAAYDPTMFFISLVVGATIMVLIWLMRRGNDNTSVQSERNNQKKRTTEPISSKNIGNKASKKKPALWRKPGNIAQFTHPELLTSLKGHIGSITSGGFSSNGKHFISAADVGSGGRFDPGGRRYGKMSHSKNSFVLDHTLDLSCISEGGSSSMEEVDTSSVSSSSHMATSSTPSDTEDSMITCNISKMSRRQRKNKNKNKKCHQEDRTVLLWSTKDFNQREHKSVRGNIEYDYATKVCWSPDGKAFIVHKSIANTIEVYKVSKRPDGVLANPQVALTFPQHNEIADVIAMDVAVSGKFIMTCNNKNQLVIWSVRGEIMDTLDTRHGDTYSATLSPCGRFIATTGFTPDVKVWEVKFGKTGNFEGVKRAYDLTGHKAGIYSCGINSDSTRMVSVSKDGTWKLFDTNIEYEKGQLVYLLLTGNYDSKDHPAKIRLSPDGRTAVIASGATLMFFSAITGEKLNTISDIYSGDIVDLFFDPSNKLVLTLGDKHVRVFHNVAGYMATIQDLEQSHRKAANSTMRERINQQIKDAKKALEDIKKVTRGQN